MTQALSRLIWEGDICVIGAGPAGSTVARQLSTMGYSVCVVEARPFPRPHIGESLLPGILPVLESLGLREIIEATGFRRPEATMVLWSGKQELTPLHGSGMQVDRAHFDALLLDAAAAKGAHVLCEARASRPKREDSGLYRVPICIEGKNEELRARFVVDASGRRAVLGGQKQRTGEPMIALYGYFRGVALGGVESRVEAAEDCWYWGAPLPDRTVVAAVFMDAERFDAETGQGLQRFYCDMLARSRLLSGCLKGALVGRVVACDAASYVDPSPIGDGWIKVGEAGLSIDPLSSQGVEVAMVSGIQAAVVVDTILSDPSRARQAVQFYVERQSELSAMHSALAAQKYAEASFRGHPFWDRRGKGAAPTGTVPAVAAPAVAAPAVAAPDVAAPAVAALPPSQPADVDASLIQLADPGGGRISRSRSLNIVTTEVSTASGTMIVKAIEHPRLNRPVAYLGGVLLAPLVEEIKDGDTVRELLARWSQHVPQRVARSILNWLRARGLVVVEPARR